MISMVVSWRDRNELKLTLPSMINAMELFDGDITIVNYNGDTQLLHEQIDQMAYNVKVVNVLNEKYFNKPRSQNIGAYSSTRDMLFFCDCDILFDQKTLIDLFEKVNYSEESFGTFFGVQETIVNARKGSFVTCFGYELHIKTDNNREIYIVDHEEDANSGRRNAPGLLMVRRSHFELIQGYNSRLDGWGWEDQDMICRLTLGAGLTRVQHGEVKHISHDDQARMGAYPFKDRWESRDKMFRRALDNYNCGNFLGSFQQDVKSYISQVSM